MIPQNSSIGFKFFISSVVQRLGSLVRYSSPVQFDLHTMGSQRKGHRWFRKIRRWKTLDVQETVNVPKALRESFRKEGRNEAVDYIKDNVMFATQTDLNAMTVGESAHFVDDMYEAARNIKS